jgi:hypothetical protein
MPGADASRKRVIIRPEAAFNEAPAANNATLRKRITEETLTHSKISATSDEIRGDLERTDSVMVGVDANGELRGDFSYGNWDAEIEAAIGGTWTANVLKNGVVKRSFGIERAFLDIAKFHYFRGMTVNTLEIDAGSRKLVGITVGYMGTRVYESVASVAGATAITEPNDNSPIPSGPTVQLFDSGGANIELNDIETKQVKLNVARNLRIRDLVTQLESAEFGRGARDITVTLNAYFKNDGIYTGFLADEFFSLVYSLRDPVDDTKAYRITLPRLKIPSMNPTSGGIETDVMLPITAKAFLDDAVGYSIMIEREVDLTP